MTRARPIAAMQHVRSFLVLAAFFVFTLPLMPLQFVFLVTGSRLARSFPHWYHRQVCRILGARLHVEGAPLRPSGVLLISNHVSWLDISVLSALAPVSFVAKSEVATWPFVSWLAKLQRSVFVDRGRRSQVGGKASEILARLKAGDNVVLFAEGTSSDGNNVLPFMTSLFAAVKPSGGGETSGETGTGEAIRVQTVALAYLRIYGLPVCRRGRHLIGWYGDMDMASHGWRLLGLGPLDVHIRVGEPVPLDAFADRKTLARYAEDEVRRNVIALLRGRDEAPAEPVTNRAA